MRWTQARIDELKSYYDDDAVGIAVAKYFRHYEKLGNNNPGL
jgi:hypothetical protein